MSKLCDVLARRVRVRPRWGLFWQVFGLNAGLLVLAVVLLAATPATISHPISLAQGVMLAVSCIVALGANALLLHVSLRPLRRLVVLMANVDLLRPGQRLKVGGAREFVLVSQAFNEMLERLEQERRSSTLRLLAGHEAERRRLARELHDEVGQSLTALLLLLRPAVDEAPRALQESLRESQQLTRSTLDEVRRMGRQLRPTVLDDLGLEAGLRALCDVVERTARTSIAQVYDENLPGLSDEVELALYRTAQEALTNVVRHAQATNILLDLGRSNGDVRLTISDDGRGMTYRGNELGGIRGMRERAVAVGGEMAIRSSPGRGTTVTITAPVEASG
jgi:two-component system, NarL family, sensor histidine kinase UhpB